MSVIELLNELSENKIIAIENVSDARSITEHLRNENIEFSVTGVTGKKNSQSGFIIELKDHEK